MITVEEADRLAAALLGDLRTALGGSHIEHARRVAAHAEVASDEAVVAAALLHDVVEKGRISMDELLTATGDRRVVEIVDTLTHRAEESEHDYLVRCASSPTALAIKRVDLADKLDPNDATVSPGDVERIKRAARQRLDLLECLAQPPAS